SGRLEGRTAPIQPIAISCPAASLTRPTRPRYGGSRCCTAPSISAALFGAVSYRSGRAKPDLVSWRRLERARGDRPDAADSSCYGRGRNNAKHCGRRPMFCRKTAAILYPTSEKAFDCRPVPAGHIYVFTSGGDGRRPFLARLRQLKPGEAVLSVITYGELAGSFTLSIIPPRAHNGLLYWC